MSFWQVADASPAHWPEQRSLTEPTSMAIAELIQQICSIDLTKAQRVVEQVCHGCNWNYFKEVSPKELQTAGLTQKQTARLIAALEFGKRALTMQPRTENLSDPFSASAALQYDLGYSSVEKAALLILDIKNHLIAKEIISIGSQSECLVEPKVVFERILRNHGIRFILAHNHPSGNSKPSSEDIELTQRFLQASKLMNIGMMDHLVIVQNGYTSIRQNNPSLWIGHDD